MSPEVAVPLKLAAGIALPLSFPFVFAAIWLLAYKLSDKPLPAKSIKTVAIWAVLTITIVPFSIGHFLLAAAVAHSELPISLYVVAGSAVCLWFSIVPILLYKTATHANTAAGDVRDGDRHEEKLSNSS